MDATARLEVAGSHFAHKPVLVHHTHARLSGTSLWVLGPHLLDVLEKHVAMAVEGLDAREQLAVVAERNEDLVVLAHGGLQDGERALLELVFFDLGDLILTAVGLVWRW